MTTPTCYLIDASIYIFRAWFSIPDAIRGADDQPVNAVYGFARFLTEFVERSEAQYVAVAFDESLTSSFRNDIYPQYKMNRELPPTELAAQFALCRRLAEAAGLFCMAHSRYEADDLIATGGKQLRDEGARLAIVTADKDLGQVIRGKDFCWDFARNQQLDQHKIKEKFGVAPEVLQDYLGLCGDSVDNIPGVPGVGAKTATALLQHFGDMDKLYQRLDEVSGLSIRGAKTLAQKLTTHEEQARLSRLLATVSYDAPINLNKESIRRHHAEISNLQEISHLIGGRGDGLFARLAESAKSVVIQ